MDSRVSSRSESEFLAESQGMTAEVDIWSHSEENSDIGPTVQRLPPRLLAWWPVDTDVQGLLTTCRHTASCSDAQRHFKI